MSIGAIQPIGMDIGAIQTSGVAPGGGLSIPIVMHYYRQRRT